MTLCVFVCVVYLLSALHVTFLKGFGNDSDATRGLDARGLMAQQQETMRGKWPLLWLKLEGYIVGLNPCCRP